MITKINEFKKYINESIDWKEQLDELLCCGYNPDGKALWDSLTEEQKEEYKEHYYLTITNFAEAGNWEDGIEPTREEAIESLMYVLTDGGLHE